MVTKLNLILLESRHVGFLFWSSKCDCLHLFFFIYPSVLDFLLTYIAFLPSCRSNETSGGAEETRGAPQPGAAEAKADRDEVCFFS